MIYVSRLPKMFRLAAYIAAFLTGLAASLFLGGCGAAPSAGALYEPLDGGLEIDRPLEAPELALPPTWEGSPEMFDLGPVPEQYHGGKAAAGYGVKIDGNAYLQDGGETTWAFSADSEPSRFQQSAIRGAFNELGLLLPNWTFAELKAPNGRTDIVIHLGDGDPNPGCLDRLESGPCWFASAQCAVIAPPEVKTGVAHAYVCERFRIKVGVRAIEGFADAFDLDVGALYQSVLTHEIGHTLGLDHAPKTSKSIMRASVPIVGLGGRTEQATFSDCELAQLRAYLPMPGAWAPLDMSATPEECEPTE